MDGPALVLGQHVDGLLASVHVDLDTVGPELGVEPVHRRNGQRRRAYQLVWLGPQNGCRSPAQDLLAEPLPGLSLLFCERGILLTPVVNGPGAEVSDAGRLLRIADRG